jgi:TetR/AcrR family transcriptional regulator, regulator of autoinduction and epiphytic fitness
MAGREAASKERRRTAIMAAARGLLEERAGERCTVDEVAERAGVSRRTIFNYFPSMDELVVAVGADLLGELVDALEAGIGDASGTDDPAHVLDDLEGALRAVDLVAMVIRLTVVLGGFGQHDPRIVVTVQDTFARLTGRLSDALARRHPGVDRYAIDLMVGAVINGVLVVYLHWSSRTGVTDDAASRRVWAALLDRLIRTVRHGHVATATAAPLAG